MELLNDDQHGKRVLYYILDKTEKEGVEQIPQKQIAADLNIPLAKVADLVRKLEAADLLQPAPQFGMASGFKDTVMLDCLRYQFYIELQDLAGEATARESIQTQIDWLWQEIERIKGSLKYFYGVKGEEQIREMMASWQGELVEGHYYGAAEKVFLPRFDPTSFASVNLRQLGLMPGEIDVYAEHSDEQGQRRAWAVEVRKQDRPVSLPEAVEFQKKLEALQQHQKIASLQGWMVSQFGFSKNAMAFLSQHNIYHSVIPRE
jgi:DNA-binding Lrp family transcriptional regulator